MIIIVSDIIRSNGASIDVEFNEIIEGLNTYENGYEFDSPVSFKGKLTNVKGILRLSGHVDVEYGVKCYRCLKDLKHTMGFDIIENFVSVNDSTDDEFYSYEGYSVKIDKALKDNIILNLPMKQVCDAECKGLCPKCGANLNEKVCDCSEDEINPQMEKLKNFFKNKQ